MRDSYVFVIYKNKTIPSKNCDFRAKLRAMCFFISTSTIEIDVKTKRIHTDFNDSCFKLSLKNDVLCQTEV